MTINTVKLSFIDTLELPVTNNQQNKKLKAANFFDRFKARGNLTLGILQLDNVRYHTHFIGLLKFLGKIEVLSIGNKTIYLNKASLIKKYQSLKCCDESSDKNKIINSIRFHFKCLQSPVRTEDPQSRWTSIQALDLHQSSDKRSRNRDQDSLGYLDLAQDRNFAGVLHAGRVIRGETDSRQKALNIINTIESSLKEALRQIKGADLHKAIQDQFKMLRLMEADGTWKDHGLTEHQDLLMPSETNAWAKCFEFVDQIIVAAKKNPYLLAAIGNLDESQLQSLKQKAKVDGIKMMQYLIPYAIALDGLTSVFAGNIELFTRIDKLWSTEKRPHYALKYLNLFGLIKYYTLGRLLKLTEPIKAEKVSRDHARYYINLNIIEAVIADKYLGNKNNANAGWALIQHPVGGESNPQTGSGPASIGKKRGYPVIELRPDFPKQWADLYSVWNLTFCSNADTFPLLAVKLLIPSVNNYASNPQGYIFHRGIALYLYFQFAIFRKLNGESSFLGGWNFAEVTRAMGESTATSAQEYLNKCNTPARNHLAILPTTLEVAHVQG